MFLQRERIKRRIVTKLSHDFGSRERITFDGRNQMRSMKSVKLAILVTILLAGVVGPGVAKDRGALKNIGKTDSRDRKGKEGGQRRQGPQQGPRSQPTQKANDNKSSREP